jgi:hypothetical protein
MTLPPALFAAGVVLIGALRYEPVILRVEFSDGTVERMAAVSPEACLSAVRAIGLGLWAPVGAGVASARCEAGNLFGPDEMCMKGFNCLGDR